MANYEMIDPDQLEVGDTIYSRISKRPFRVTGFCKYALDCSIPMIRFKNIKDTDDTPAGQEWVLDESTVIVQFRVKG